jgi:hypothetical protein
MTKIDESLMRNLCEGLVGYGSFESRAGLGSAMSELVFYMPTLRIAKHLQWQTRVEYEAAYKENPKGDKPRVDFAFKRKSSTTGSHGVIIEMKWNPPFLKKDTAIKLLDSELDKFQFLKKSKEWKSLDHFSAWQLVLGRKKSIKIDPAELKLIDSKNKMEWWPDVSFSTDSGLQYYCNAYRVIERITPLNRPQTK